MRTGRPGAARPLVSGSAHAPQLCYSTLFIESIPYTHAHTHRHIYRCTFVLIIKVKHLRRCSTSLAIRKCHLQSCTPTRMLIRVMPGVGDIAAQLGHLRPVAGVSPTSHVGNDLETIPGEHM